MTEKKEEIKIPTRLTVGEGGKLEYVDMELKVYEITYKEDDTTYGFNVAAQSVEDALKIGRRLQPDTELSVSDQFEEVNIDGAFIMKLVGGMMRSWEKEKGDK